MIAVRQSNPLCIPSWLILFLPLETLGAAWRQRAQCLGVVPRQTFVAVIHGKKEQERVRLVIAAIPLCIPHRYWTHLSLAISFYLKLAQAIRE